MSGVLGGRRAAVRLGFGVGKLDHQMTRLFDVLDCDFLVLKGFEIDLDIIDESVFSLAETHERGLVVEMQELIRKQRVFFGDAFEGLSAGREPHEIERGKAFETAGRIETLCFLLARQDEHRLAIYRFGAALAAATTLAALGEGEDGEGWVDARAAQESLPPPERTIAHEAFCFDLGSGEHLVDSFGERWKTFEWLLSKLDSEGPSVQSPSASGAVGGKRPRHRAVNEERDKWLYEELCSDKPQKEILNNYNGLAPSRGWFKLGSVQAIRRAARAYYMAHGLEPFRPRKNYY